MERLRAFISLDIFRNFLKLFSSTVLAQGLSFVLAPLLSRLYTPEEFGLVALYMGVLSILSVISTGKYEQAIMLPLTDRVATTLFWLVQLITIAFSLLVLVLVVTFNSYITFILGNPLISPWLYFLPLSLLLHGLFQGATYYANRKKMFGSIAGGTVSQYTVLNATRIGTGLADSSFNGLIAAQLAGQLSGAVYMVSKTRRRLMRSITGISLNELKLHAAEYSGYPRYNLILNLTNNLSGSLPIFMFTWGFSAEAAGLYAFGYTFIFRPLSLLSQSTLQVLSQKIIEDHHQGRWIYPALKKLVLRFFSFGLFPFVMLAILGPWLFGVIFSESYALSGRILQILTPWLFIVFLTSPLSFVPELFFRQKKAMIIDMIYLVLRFFAIGIGIWFENLWLSLWLFSGVSMGVVLYSLIWYLQLAYSHRQGNLTGQ